MPLGRDGIAIADDLSRATGLLEHGLSGTMRFVDGFFVLGGVLYAMALRPSRPG
ncbi:hypothetical protein [Streptomyces sp. NPDC058953]|uniref:hypothetical protein n=1 Tax=Streptomyces sp. NPDC058953 TaxID=3346676 RepID=UPI0036B74497